MNRVISFSMVILLTLTIGVTIVAAPVFSAVAWSENWDLYPPFYNMHGVDGWKGWDNDPTWTALTNPVHYLSSPNSIEIVGITDIVHEFPDYGFNVWVLTAQQFIPSDFSGVSYFILMYDYNDGGPYYWGTQIEFVNAGNIVQDTLYNYNTLPLIRDEWVEIRIEIDMLADSQKCYYGGNLLYDIPFVGDDITTVDAIDLFANGSSPVYYDNLSIAEAEAAIDIQKFTNGEDADTPTGPVVSVGSPITWRYEVTNTGNVNLTGIQVTDDRVGSVCGCDPLLPGETFICEVYSGIAAAGQYANVGTVTAYYGSTEITDSDPSHYFGSSNGPGTEPGPEVGGDIYQPNKIALLGQWFGVLIMLAIITVIYMLRHRIHSQR